MVLRLCSWFLSLGKLVASLLCSGAQRRFYVYFDSWLHALMRLRVVNVIAESESNAWHECEATTLAAGFLMNFNCASSRKTSLTHNVKQSTLTITLTAEQFLRSRWIYLLRRWRFLRKLRRFHENPNDLKFSEDLFFMTMSKSRRVRVAMTKDMATYFSLICVRRTWNWFNVSHALKRVHT